MQNTKTRQLEDFTLSPNNSLGGENQGCEDTSVDVDDSLAVLTLLFLLISDKLCLDLGQGQQFGFGVSDPDVKKSFLLSCPESADLDV